MKVYLVVSSSGSYEDRRETNHGIFDSKSIAEKLAHDIFQANQNIECQNIDNFNFELDGEYDNYSRLYDEFIYSEEFNSSWVEEYELNKAI